MREMSVYLFDELGPQTARPRPLSQPGHLLRPPAPRPLSATLAWSGRLIHLVSFTSSQEEAADTLSVQAGTLGPKGVKAHFWTGLDLPEATLVQTHHQQCGSTRSTVGQHVAPSPCPSVLVPVPGCHMTLDIHLSPGAWECPGPGGSLRQHVAAPAWLVSLSPRPCSGSCLAHSQFSLPVLG